jgi:hypothetical protein
MATNAQTALTNRQYYAAHMNFGPAPDNFVHAPPQGKPAYQPPAVQLDPVQASRLADLLAKRDFAVTMGTRHSRSSLDIAGLSADALSVLDDYENNYLNRPDMVQWKLKNEASRDSQWRNFRADVHDEAEQAGVNVSPRGSSSTGAGTNSTNATTPIAT